MLRAVQERLSRLSLRTDKDDDERNLVRSKSRSRSRSRSRRDSVDSLSIFPLTELSGERSPLDRQPTQRNGRPTGTGYQARKPCPTCVRTYWTWVAAENGVYPFDAKPPQWSPNHHHIGPYGPVTPIGITSTPFPTSDTDKQCDSYFDIPIDEQQPPLPPVPYAARRQGSQFSFATSPSPRYPPRAYTRRRTPSPSPPPRDPSPA